VAGVTDEEAALTSMPWMVSGGSENNERIVHLRAVRLPILKQSASFATGKTFKPVSADGSDLIDLSKEYRAYAH